MQQETFIIGSNEYTVMPMNAFMANKLLMRLQKIAIPVMGSFLGTGTNLGDIDVKQAAQVIAEHLDEHIMDNIVLPLFSESRLYRVENKKFIKTGIDIDQCFTIETLFELYELIFEVARFQFGPFFASMVKRFGALTEGAKANPLSRES